MSYRKFLADGRTMLLDGGNGQEIISRSKIPDTDNLWSTKVMLHEPDLVQSVHQSYIDVGCDVITTNSYAAGQVRLETGGVLDQFEAINTLSGVIANKARDASGKDVLIAGSLPPYYGSYRPDLVPELDVLVPQYEAQAKILAPYVDFFLCETMSITRESVAAVMGASELGKPIFMSWTLKDDLSLRLRSGETLSDAVQVINDMGVDVDAMLLNCSYPESISAAMGELRSLTTLPIGGYGNGFSHIPEDWENFDGVHLEKRRDLSPGRYGDQVQKWIKDGATIVGGCCEVGPDHMGHIARILGRG